jgi:hypothetical protein
MNANTTYGNRFRLGRHRFGGTFDSIAEGLMALLLSAVTIGAFVHEWRPADTQVQSIARALKTVHTPRG